MAERQSARMMQSLTDLPTSILLEILVRLPLKSLFVSGCVCKTFLSLTTPNPYFIDLHSSNAAPTLVLQLGDVSKPSRLLRLFEPELGKPESKPMFRLPRSGRCYIIPYRTNFREVNMFVLANSCNGLLYFVRRNTPDEGSLVCNPVTNEYKMIPDVDVESRLLTKSMWLGFSESANRYKVLRAFASVNGGGVEVGVRAQVLVVGSNSWQNIGDTPLGADHSWDTCSASLNGVIFWLDHSRKDMVCFNFEMDMFGEIALPHEFGDGLSNKHCMSIGVLGGCLSLSYNADYAHRVDIWVMKKPGDPESWSKEFIVDTVIPTDRPVYGRFKPLQVLRNGEILMLWMSNDLVLYDPMNKILRFVGLSRVRLNPRVVAFAPSFVSLKDALVVEKVVLQRERPRADELDA